MIGELVMFHPFAVPAFLTVSGIILALWGSRIVPFALVLFALILGVVQGGSLLVNVTDNPDVLRFGPYVLAVLLAVAVSFIYRIAFFLAGLFIGYFLCSSFFPELSSVLVWVLALVAGALVYVSRNFVFSVLTSVTGAGLAATGIVNLIAWINVTCSVAIYWVIVAVIAISGVIYQTKRNKGRK